MKAAIGEGDTGVGAETKSEAPDVGGQLLQCRLPKDGQKQRTVRAEHIFTKREREEGRLGSCLQEKL